MKKLLFLLFIIPFTFSTHAQYFNTFSNPLNSAMNSGVVYKYKGNKYITAGKALDTAYYNWGRNVITIFDSVGNVLETKYYGIYGEDRYGGRDGGKTFLQLEDSSYIWAYTMLKGNPVKQYINIMRFDQNLDTLWTKQIDFDTTYHNALGIAQTWDKGFVICGNIEQGGVSNSDVLLVKIDSLGNKLWQRVFALDLIDFAWDIVEMPEKNLMVFAFSNRATTGYGDPYVIRTDSLGNPLWIRNYGGPEFESAGTIAKSGDGNYYLAFGYAYSTQVGNSFSECQLKLLKINDQGSIIWEKAYDTIRTNYYGIKVIEHNNSIYIQSGYYGYVNSSYMLVSKLFKCDLNGNEIWNRSYAYLNEGGTVNVLTNILIEGDNNFVMCGYVYSPTVSASIWLLKTDSSGMENSVGIEENYGGALPLLHNYPNPATEFTTFEFPALETNTHLEVYSPQGIKVFETGLEKQSTSYRLDISGLSSGLYTVILKQKNQVVGVGKVMKR